MRVCVEVGVRLGGIALLVEVVVLESVGVQVVVVAVVVGVLVPANRLLHLHSGSY